MAKQYFGFALADSMFFFKEMHKSLLLRYAKIIRDDLLRENLALDPSCEEIATVLRRCEAVLSRC